MTVAEIPVVNKTIQQKFADMKPLTPRQKLEVLTNAKAVLKDRHLVGSWATMIHGVEMYCLYGAVQKVCGAYPGSGRDKNASACSLTSTMFDALPKKHGGRAELKEYIEELDDGDRRSDEYKEAQILSYKASILQSLNDDEGKTAVLRVLTTAINRLKKEIDG